jgi:hypothetical protein
MPRPQLREKKGAVEGCNLTQLPPMHGGQIPMTVLLPSSAKRAV